MHSVGYPLLAHCVCLLGYTTIYIVFYKLCNLGVPRLHYQNVYTRYKPKKILGTDCAECNTRDKTLDTYFLGIAFRNTW
jgi:hypothetical protein